MNVIHRRGRVLAAFLSVVLLLGTLGSVSASAHGRHHSRARGALIGGTVRLVGGALIGGRRGALIGAGSGAGTGYLVQRYRNHRHRRQHYYRRHRRHWRY